MDSHPEDACDHGDFSFAFDNDRFSDRLLRIYIKTADPSSGRIITLHICSAILAARSKFFYKLFSNGMSESKQCDATLQINPSEETGLMELLKFMHSNTLGVTSAHDMIDVLMTADKFDVASCVRHCIRLLRNLLNTTPEFALAYLDLPSNILTTEAFQPLTHAAKELCVARYKDIVKFEDEILRLPLVVVEVLIASDDLEVTSEYAVYLLVLKWARFNYPQIKERREIMARLAKLIRYPFMTYRELINVWNSNELEPSFASSITKEAIAFKEKALDPNDIKNNDSSRFVERIAYKRRTVKTYKHQPVDTPVQALMVKVVTGVILSTWAIGLTCVIQGSIWVFKKLWL